MSTDEKQIDPRSTECYLRLREAYGRALLALLAAERVLSHLPPAYCHPRVLAQVKDAIADALEFKP